MSVNKIAARRKLLLLGAILGFLGVILGAYGAHGLKPMISAERMESFETGVRFQIYHALFALLLGSFSFLSKRALNLIFYLLLIGILFFSGSIYGLATNDMTSFDFTKIALITPLGGLCLILSWGLLIINLFKFRKL